jgi:hypothetical protein
MKKIKHYSLGSVPHPVKPPFGAISEFKRYSDSVKATVSEINSSIFFAIQNIHKCVETSTNLNKQEFQQLLTEIKDTVKILKKLEGEIDSTNENDLGQLMSNNVLFFLTGSLAQFRITAKNVVKAFVNIENSLSNSIPKTGIKTIILKNAIENDLGIIEKEVQILNQEKMVLIAKHDIAENQLISDHSTKAETNLYYDGIYVNANVTTRDEIIPVLRHLKQILESNKPFYLTPELLAYLESLSTEEKNDIEVEKLISKITGIEKPDYSSSSSSSSSSFGSLIFTLFSKFSILT